MRRNVILTCILVTHLACSGSTTDGGGARPSTDRPSGESPAPGELPAVPSPGELPPPGAVTTTTFEGMPGGRELALEDYFGQKFLPAPARVSQAQQMYFDGCESNDGWRLFASFTLGESEWCTGDRYGDGGCEGGVIELAFDPSSGLGPTGRQVHLPECIESYGVANTDDCSKVAILCRRENLATESSAFTKNSLVTHSDADWMTHITNGERVMEELWLYEWSAGDITAEPDRYVVHRALATSYGKYSLVHGDDDTYGIGIRSNVYDPNGTMHSADALLVLDATTFDFSDRGFSWACGTGHTSNQFLAYNPVGSAYAKHCLTDFNEDKEAAGDMYVWTEPTGATAYLRNYNRDGATVGAAAGIRPLSDGGWLAVIVAIPENTEARDGALWETGEQTWIGVVRFTAEGQLVGDVRWVVGDSEGLLSNPQLAPLGDDRFLLGYGTMHRFSSYDASWEIDYKVPHEYHVFEIDADGNRLTDELDLPDDVGWGMWDEMVALGDGRVAWLYTPTATVPLESAAESSYPIERTKLSAHVYESNR